MHDMTDVSPVRRAPEASWLTPDQVAEEMNCSTGVVRKYWERFGGIRVGNLYRFPPNYLDHLRSSEAIPASTDEPGRAAS
jgi:hypothetical protein